MPTLTQYRRTLAPLLGEVEVGTADAGVATTVLGVSTPLASGARVRSTVLPASLFRGKWLHRPDATDPNDRDRLIAEYAPTTGLLTPDEPWTVSPGGEVFEILGLFSGSDLNALVNEALKRLWVVHEVTLTPPLGSNVRRHDLTAALPALTNPRWVFQVGHLQAGESRTGTATLAAVDPFSRSQVGTLEALNRVVYLDGPSWTTTQTPYVKVVLPAYYLCKPAAGAYGDQSGLALETDEAPVDERWLAWTAVLAGADRIDHLERTGQATQEAMRARQMAAARVTRLTQEHFRPPERTLTPPRISIAPTSGWAW